MATVRRLEGIAPRCQNTDVRRPINGNKKTLFFVKTNTMGFAVTRSEFNKKKKENHRRGSQSYH